MATYRTTHFVRALIGYLVVLLVVFWPILRPHPDRLLFGDDIHRSYYFFSQYLAASVKQGFLPWWNPYMFSGTPFMANPITNAMYPVNWLFFVLPATVVYPLSLMLHVLIAMMGMYTLLRRVMSNVQYPISKEKPQRITHLSSLITQFPAWGAGIVFGLSSFFAARIYAGHIDVIAAASWMPWVIAAFAANFKFQILNFKLEESVQKYQERRGIVLAGVILALQLLAGYQTMAILTLIAVGIIALVQAISTRSIIPLLIVILGVLIALGLASVVLIPIQQFVGLSIRTFAKPYAWSSLGSLVPKELIQLISPFALGDQYTYHGYPPNYWEHAIFVGRVGLALAVVAFFARRRSSVLFIAAIATVVFGLWVSLGSHAPVDLNYWLWRFVPVYHFLRIPSRHLLLVIFGLSVLAGFGLTLFKNRWIQKSIILLMSIEMIFYAQHFIGAKESPESRHDKELVTLLQSSNDRILPNFGVWVPPRDSLDFDSVMEYKLFSTTGYDSTLLRNYYEFIDAVNGAKKPSILEHDVQVPYTNIHRSNWKILGVKYLFVPTYIDVLNGTSNDQFTLLREDLNRQYRLYEVKDVTARFFFVPRARVVESREEAYALVRNQTLDLTKEAIVERKNAPGNLGGVPPCPNPAGQTIAISSYTPNRITLGVTSSCDAVLTSSEVMYPGWEATIDGKRAELFEANLAFRTLIVPAGRHSVELFFNPKIFIYGGLVSAFTILVCYIWIRKSSA
ncbi:YfhO family protein [Candidatus Gottesmanbacteria bacterium]|nr:YfhO family protein [Candidatus Gottesmanbacteria bacterium]